MEVLVAWHHLSSIHAFIERLLSKVSLFHWKFWKVHLDMKSNWCWWHWCWHSDKQSSNAISGSCHVWSLLTDHQECVPFVLWMTGWNDAKWYWIRNYLNGWTFRNWNRVTKNVVKILNSSGNFKSLNLDGVSLRLSLVPKYLISVFRPIRTYGCIVLYETLKETIVV